MSNGLLLWVGDKTELLRTHIILLEEKGYQAVAVSNGSNATDQCHRHTFDLVLLNEIIPGLTGLEALQRIKEISPTTPVVIVTKSEGEGITGQAIGSKIVDHLIKPANPNQILPALKRNIHRKGIVTKVTQSGYRQSSQDISIQIMNCQSLGDWTDIYK